MDQWKTDFAKLKAKDGVYSILGNHDYGDYYNWESSQAKVNNLNQLKEIQQEMGWKLLLDEHHSIEKGNQKIAFVGVENWGKGGFKQKDIVYYKSKESEMLIGKIINSNDKNIYLQCLQYELGGSHMSPQKNFKLMEKKIEIKNEDCIGKCSYTGEFVNRFATLNLLEK
jgi:hypothetical protein